MYEKDGVFGRTRLGYIPNKREFGTKLDMVTLSGWHSCNELYMIMRKPVNRKEYLIILTTDGVGELLVNGRRFIMRKNSVALIPFTMGHTYYAQPGKENNWTFYWLHVFGKNSACVIDEIIDRFDFSFQTQIADMLTRDMLAIIDSKLTGVEYEIDSARLVSEFLLNLLLSKTSEKKSSVRNRTCSSRFIDYVDKHIDECLSVENIAGLLFLSPEHLIRTFRKEMGQTPYQYIKARKLARAKELIRVLDLPLKEIATMIGYLSLNAFSTQFKNATGMTPSEYRQKCKQ